MNNTVLCNASKKERVKASELPSWLLSRGISSITTDEIAALLAIPGNQVPQRLAAPRKRSEMVLLANGLWMPVPPEYMTWGAPPAIDVIDALMRHMNAGYYVGWLSAAAFHGASHHAPQVFQVAVSRAIRSKIIGRSKLQFYHRSHIGSAVTVNVESKNGAVPISSREMTMLDIAAGIGIVGGIHNAANIIIELCETTAPDFELLTALSTHYPSSAIRRLGFIMERFTDIPALESLKLVSDSRETSTSLLDPQSPNVGKINNRWRLKINQEVSPDV